MKDKLSVECILAYSVIWLATVDFPEPGTPLMIKHSLMVLVLL
jgi:hypothetical protein